MQKTTTFFKLDSLSTFDKIFDQIAHYIVPILNRG